jgi:hypothetical protein
MATKKNTKKAARRSFDFQLIERLWKQNKTYVEIAKAIGRYKKDAETEDAATKSTRAVISNMLRGVAGAWKDKSGKPCRLQPREGMRAIGVGKKLHRSPKKATKAVQPKGRAQRLDGKTLAAGGAK